MAESILDPQFVMYFFIVLRKRIFQFLRFYTYYCSFLIQKNNQGQLFLLKCIKSLMKYCSVWDAKSVSLSKLQLHIATIQVIRQNVLSVVIVWINNASSDLKFDD